MRSRLALTQAELAAKLNVAVQTVGRWESYGPPRGATLERLAKWAEEVGYTRAADFRALSEFERGIERPLWFSVDSEEESHVTLAVLEVLRKPEWEHLRGPLKHVLQPVREHWAYGFSELRRMMEAVQAIKAEALVKAQAREAISKPTSETPKTKKRKKT